LSSDADGLIIPLRGCAKPRWLGNVVRLVWERRVTGILILLFGMYTLAVPGGHGGHDHSAHQTMQQQ
jgi:hypothetical protein